MTRARSSNCGMRAADLSSPAGAAEKGGIEATESFRENDLQPSRWDELCWCAPDPQLKLRATINTSLRDDFFHPHHQTPACLANIRCRFATTGRTSTLLPIMRITYHLNLAWKTVFLCKI